MLGSEDDWDDETGWYDDDIDDDIDYDIDEDDDIDCEIFMQTKLSDL